jgi:hypothetical protein
MGTTTFTAYVRPSAVSSNSGGFVAYVPVRVLSGIYQGVGIPQTRDLRNLRTFFPHWSVPIIAESGRMSGEWYRFLDFFVNVFTDLNSSITMSDIKQSLEITQAQATANAALAAATQAQVTSNAQALATTREVVQTASLAGSTQIPPVQLVPAEPTYEWSTGGGDGGTSGSDF